MVLKTQQLITQLMPTLVGDQVPIAADALNQLQLWTQGLWGHPIQLVQDSATDSGDTTAATVPMEPTTTGSRPRGTELGRPAGEQLQGEVPLSLGEEDMPGTETEDELRHIARRRRSATRSDPATQPVVEEDSGDPGSEAASRTSHRQRGFHAAMSDD